MKKLTLIIISLLSLGIYSCNNSGDKKAETTPAAAGGDSLITSAYSCPGEWIIMEAEAKAMIDSFKSIYIHKNGLSNLAESIWIDALVIRSYAAFLESSQGSSFDGARFINGAAANRDKTMLYLVPTKQAPNGYHTEVWSNKVFSLLEGTPVRFQDYNILYENAEGNIAKFESLRKPTTEPGKNIDSLSTEIWIPKCVFWELKQIIEDPKYATDPITGVNVIFGAYKDKSHKVGGQKYDNQSTVVLVPTSSDGAQGNSDRWDIIKTPKYKRNKDAFNHGELCPTKCD